MPMQQVSLGRNVHYVSTGNDGFSCTAGEEIVGIVNGFIEDNTADIYLLPRLDQNQYGRDPRVEAVPADAQYDADPKAGRTPGTWHYCERSDAPAVHVARGTVGKPGSRSAGMIADGMGGWIAPITPGSHL